MTRGRKADKKLKSGYSGQIIEHILAPPLALSWRRTCAAGLAISYRLSASCRSIPYDGCLFWAAESLAPENLEARCRSRVRWPRGGGRRSFPCNVRNADIPLFFEH